MKESSSTYRFRLYVTGNAHNSRRAIANLSQLCDLHLADRHHIEIVDLSREPERALSDEVYLTPTLIKLAPGPKAQVIGSLHNMSELLDLLELERKS
ncbi:MAG: circadian clock KaiB family protein [Steroidobacteraceae bacterium]